MRLLRGIGAMVARNSPTFSGKTFCKVKAVGE